MFGNLCNCKRCNELFCPNCTPDSDGLYCEYCYFHRDEEKEEQEYLDRVNGKDEETNEST